MYRKLERFQGDLKHCQPNAFRCLEHHMAFFIDFSQKLRMDDQPRWGLRGGYGLTEKFPVPQAFTLLNTRLDVRRSTSKETNCS